MKLSNPKLHTFDDIVFEKSAVMGARDQSMQRILYVCEVYQNNDVTNGGQQG